MSFQQRYAESASMLIECLDLQQPPIAISFSATVPESMNHYSGRVAAGCRFWEDGARQAFVTSAGDHRLCSIGVYTHNLEPSPSQQADLQDALEVFAKLDYLTAADIPSIPVLAERPEHIAYAPLASSPVPPDVVLLFVNANQALVLCEAVQQVEQQNVPAMGRPACAVVPQVVNTGRAALSLGCCGARAYLDGLTPGFAIFAFPGTKLEAYVRRVEALVKANKVLSSFHTARRRAVEAGATPSIQDSLAAMD